MSSNVKEEDLVNAIKGKYKGFNARVVEVPYKWEETDLSVRGNYYYLTFRDGLPTIDHFVQYIYDSIVPFCIPATERTQCVELFNTTQEWRYLQATLDKARNLFAKAKKSIKTSGELGELILFILIEAVLKAPQIACKMYLKTNVNVNVHGSDSIHVRLVDNGTLQLIWGESKIYQQLTIALDEICDSLTKFNTSTEGRTPRERDLEVITDYMNIEDSKLKEELLRYFDPYEELSNDLEECYACFVGFDHKEYALLNTYKADELETKFLDTYKAKIDSTCKLFGSKLRGKGLMSIRVHFFLLPFPDVSVLRKKFFEKLGVSDD